MIDVTLAVIDVTVMTAMDGVAIVDDISTMKGVGAVIYSVGGVHNVIRQHVLGHHLVLKDHRGRPVVMA